MFDRLAVQPMPQAPAPEMGRMVLPEAPSVPVGQIATPSVPNTPIGQMQPPTAPMPARHPSMTFNDPQASSLAFSNPQGVQSRLWGAPTPNMSMPQAGPGGLFGLYSQGMR